MLFICLSKDMHLSKIMPLLILSEKLDILALRETRLTDDDPEAITLDMASPGLVVIHAYRIGTTNRNRRGGLSLVYRNCLRVKCQP